MYSHGHTILHLPAKFRSNQMIVSEVMMKSPIHAHFGGFGGLFSPNDVTHRPNPQKALPYVETRRLSHKAWKSVQRFDWGAFPRKKVRTGQDSQTKKSRSGNISPIWGEAPTAQIETKFCMVGQLAEVIMYAKFQVEIFRGYDFTGVEFPIFLLIFAWALQCAACDQKTAIFAANSNNNKLNKLYLTGAQILCTANSFSFKDIGCMCQGSTWHPLSTRYELTLAAFDVWRVDISHTGVKIPPTLQNYKAKAEKRSTGWEKI